MNPAVFWHMPNCRVGGDSTTGARSAGAGLASLMDHLGVGGVEDLEAL